jgi:radical SAM-linked protein
MKFYYLLNYTKIGEFRFCSHLELKAVWERTLRKAGLPVAYSQGFNPQIRLSFPWALPINVASFDEYLKIELVEWISEKEFAAILQLKLPKEVGLKKVTEIQKNKIETKSFVYRIDLTKILSLNTLEILCKKLLEQNTLNVTREKKGKKRTFNARDFIDEIYVISGSQIQLSLKFTLKGSVKINEILELLGLQEHCGLITKLKSEIILS